MSAVAAAVAAPSLRFEDHSARARCGCKGPGAESWLRSQGYRLSAAPNSATLDADGVLVARLATSEFLIEAVEESVASCTQRVASTHAQLRTRAQPRTVYPVARADLVISICGEGLNALLRQTCSVDFAPLLAAAPADDGRVILTSMIGVGVVAWPHGAPAGPALTLWCEPSYAHYFWNTLLEVGRDAGGVTINRSET